ncbi:hypothetical protein BASA50_008250 [Batrachochytrium salamandrivorans]|uniref:Uncharacterized protein n=1 Tax=Batrachochytrium salamandrivorans TaxID=1357716 RepID=A0ABQ8F544_9FUNG|nr:hypothetical protein BASA50_008250 [Batrachochytrium salamandrivorans]
MKTASILVISLLAIIGGAAPAPALDGDNLQLYKRQAPPESPVAPPRPRKQERLLKQEQERDRKRPLLLPKPDRPKPGRPIPAPRLSLLAKLGNPNSNDGTKEVETTIHNSPEGEGSSLEESDEEEDNNNPDSNSQPTTPEKITTPKFDQQSNVKGAPKRRVPLLLPPRKWLPVAAPPSPEFNDEDSNSNDGAKEVKDESSNKPTGEVDELQRKIAARQAGEKGSSGAPQVSKHDVDPKPENVKTSKPDVFADELQRKIAARQAGGGGSSGTPQILKDSVLPKPGGAKAPQSNGFADELQRKMAARQARGGGSSGTPQVSKHDVDPKPENVKTNSGGAINGNDNLSSQQSKIAGSGVKSALTTGISASKTGVNFPTLTLQDSNPSQPTKTRSPNRFKTRGTST